MAGEIFYPPPFPQQARRFVPIPQQGDQPPRYNVAGAMAIVLASWPTGYEYEAPQRRPTVPIPAQGDQPPRKTGHRDAALLTAWIGYGDYQPYQLARRPPIPTPGDQPPRTTPAGLYNLIRAWDQPDPAPYQRRLTVPIPAPTVSGQVPYTRLSDAILASWQPDVPTQPRRVTVPIPAQGNTPPKVRAAPPYSIWIAETYSVQPSKQSAAVIPVPVVSGQVPYTRLPDAILASWQPDAPPRPRTVTAPIPAQGSQPPRQSWVNLRVILTTWEPLFPASQGPPRTQIVSVDRPPRLRQLLPYTLWQPEPWPAQSRPNLVQPAAAPPTVNDPPRRSLVNLFVIRDSWEIPFFAVQRLPKLVTSILITVPAPGDVLAGVVYDAFNLPTVGQVRLGVVYGPGDSMVGTLVLPVAGRVRSGDYYGAGGTEFLGVDFTPATSDVRLGVKYGNLNVEFTGTLQAAPTPPARIANTAAQGVNEDDLITYLGKLIGITCDFVADTNGYYRDVVLWEHPSRVQDTGRQVMVWYKVNTDAIDKAQGMARYGNRVDVKFDINLVTRGFADGTQRDVRKRTYHNIYRWRLIEALQNNNLFTDYYTQPVNPAVWTPPVPIIGPPLTIEPMYLVGVPGTSKTQYEEGTIETAFTVVLPCVLALTLPTLE